MTSADIQNLIFRYIVIESNDKRLGRGQHYLAEGVRNTAPQGSHLDNGQIMEGAWAFIEQGLAYIDYFQSAVENWNSRLRPMAVLWSKMRGSILMIQPDTSGALAVSCLI